jgi:hypothetical protein
MNSPSVEHSFQIVKFGALVPQEKQKLTQSLQMTALDLYEEP